MHVVTVLLDDVLVVQLGLQMDRVGVRGGGVCVEIQQVRLMVDVHVVGGRGYWMQVHVMVVGGGSCHRVKIHVGGGVVQFRSGVQIVVMQRILMMVQLMVVG